MAARLTRPWHDLPPLIRLIPLMLCIITTVPGPASMVATELTQANGTSAETALAASLATSERPPLTEAPAARTGSEEHFRAEAADLLGHVTALLRHIQPQRYPKGLQSTIELVVGGEQTAAPGDWWRLAQQLVSADPVLSAVVISCVILSVLVPVVAAVICCRRLCTHSEQTEADDTEEDTHGQKRCRANCNIAIIVFTLCIIFCLVVLLLAAAVLIRSGLLRSGPALSSALSEVQAVSADVSARLTRLLTSDLEKTVSDTQRLIEDAAHQSTEQITLRLANQSGMTHLFKSLFQLDSRLQAAAAGFLTLDSDLTNLTSEWPGLVLRLGDLRTDLEQAVALCAPENRQLCADLQPSQLTLTELDISTGVLKPSVSLVQRYRTVDLPESAAAAQASVTALANSLQAAISTARPGIDRELQDSASRAERHLTQVRPTLQQLHDHLRGLAESSSRRPLVEDVTATGIWSSALAVPCLVLVVTALLYGAVVGSYFPSRKSSRPHRHVINTIRLALVLLVLASALVWAAAAVGALAAGLVRAGLCPGTGHDRPAEVAQVMHRMGLTSVLVPVSDGADTPTLADTLRQCQTGGSFLDVFHLAQPADVAAAARLDTPRMLALIDRADSRSTAEGRSGPLAGTLDPYLRLAEDLVKTDLGSIKTELERRAPAADVPGVLSRLSAALSRLSSDSDRDRLGAVAERLTKTVTGPLYALQKQKARLVVQVATFDMSLMSLRGQVTDLAGHIAQVDRFLATNASRVIQQEEANFRGQIRGRLEEYTHHVQKVLLRDVGCLPVWHAFRFAASTSCRQLLGGAGAYWLGSMLTGCLLLLLAAATQPLLTRLSRSRRHFADEPSTEDDSKLWRSVTSEMQETAAKTVSSGPEPERSSCNGDDGRW